MDCHLEPDQLPFGLPLPLLTKHLVSLTGDRHLQVHSYLLEFSQSLCVLGDLPQALQWALNEATLLTSVESSKDIVCLHHKLLELATSEWIVSPDIGAMHSTEVYRQVSVCVCVCVRSLGIAGLSQSMYLSKKLTLFLSLAPPLPLPLSLLPSPAAV